MRTIIVKNIDSESHVWAGQEFSSGFEYTLQDVDVIRFATSTVFFSDYGSGKAQIGNGNLYFSSNIDGWNWLIGTITQDVNLKNIDITSSAEKALKVADTKLEGSSTMFCSPNLCDKTSWYCGSKRVTLETLTDSGNHLKYTGENQLWVDISHGKIPYEDRIDAAGTLYKPHVFVDDVEITTGFDIDYVSGGVLFETSQEGKTVKATYSYADSMEWVIAPTSGKILKLLGTEIKFTDDCDMNGNQVTFQVYIGSSPFGAPTTYKNMEDIVKCCMGTGWTMPKLGSIDKSVVLIPFSYITSKDLKYSQGTSIKVYLSTKNPVIGTFACCIGHCISLSE